MLPPSEQAIAAHQRLRSLLFFNHLSRVSPGSTPTGLVFNLTDGSFVKAAQLLGVDSSEGKFACKDVTIWNTAGGEVSIGKPVVLRGDDIKCFSVSVLKKGDLSTKNTTVELDY
ncbi:hypothetical protein BABINDRAFT_169314 [Babjeviella inositovora NRRL Y-12698]|uniref:Uncharacterized protein n=1 Tax=Babjeviella inositovora NRRL Y-12698 TaxID=984486 RepID=A0A1E3QHL5_9ASCO|nr:uncharacterized protein BABINDRAFT_169314 [Babjeviella inositovora NRRL Y-12698]ODQ77186.1 hypothetical protein BABINDRAFT_169314 [Babjeviella inositovora NRRL Y-12698]